MTGLKRAAGAYMVLVALAVAVFFIINAFLLDSIDVPGIWYVLDVLMLVGLASALFYLTAAVTILFLHNWLSLLALGGDSLDGNHQAGHLGDCRYAGSHHVGRHRMPSLVRS